MIIDFHTHIFPDELAPKALKSLLENIDYRYTPVTDQTEKGLLAYMNRWNIDLSVNQPVLTKQSQFIKTNLWARDICSNRIISFGGLYPHTNDFKADIDFIVELGLKGIKLHPEYQDFVVDDNQMLRLYDYALSKGLILLFHGGEDPGMPKPYKSSPQQFARIADAMQGGIIVVAHFGGHAQWEDVEQYLVGKNLYLDTSMGFDFYSKEQFICIVKAHGSSKILFASDSPWSNAATEIECIQSLALPQSDIKNILGLNARRLLHI